MGLFYGHSSGIPMMIDTRSPSEPVAVRPIEAGNVLSYGVIEGLTY